MKFVVSLLAVLLWGGFGLPAAALADITTPPLKLPTAAGQIVAEVSGGEALDVGALAAPQPGSESDSVAAANAAASSSGIHLDGAPANPETDWKIRGKLKQEDGVAGIQKWQVGASVSRQF